VTVESVAGVVGGVVLGTALESLAELGRAATLSAGARSVPLAHATDTSRSTVGATRRWTIIDVSLEMSVSR
jgi:hypothetical protein